MKLSHIKLGLLLTLFFTQQTFLDADWSSFQNGGKLQFKDSLAPRLSWTGKAGIAWKTSIPGYGQSSPVCHSGKVYLTSTSGPNKKSLHISAIHINTGKVDWTYDAINSSPEKSTNYVSKAASTPVCDSNGVIALFEGGNIIALNPKGEHRWQRDLVATYGPIDARHGIGSSLEQSKDHVYVWIERQTNPYVLALSKKDGEVIWKSKGIGKTSWSSPRLIPVEKDFHLVLSGIGRIVGLDPKTGKHLWTFEEIAGNSTPTPVPVGKGKFLIGATVGRGSDSGGAVSAAKSNGLIEIKRDEEGTFNASFKWRAKRATSSFGSPFHHQGHAYYVNRSGVVYCLDLETGEEKYAKRSGSSIWATPLGFDDRVYFFGKDGVTTVIRSGPEFKVLSSNPLWENKPEEQPQAPRSRGAFGGPTLYGIAFTNGNLLLRKGSTLFKIAPK